MGVCPQDDGTVRQRWVVTPKMMKLSDVNSGPQDDGTVMYRWVVDPRMMELSVRCV